MKVRILLISLALILPIDMATATDCIEKACIEVYTQDGHIVIEGRRGSGEKSTTVIPAPAKSSVPRTPSTRRAVPKPTASKSPSIKTSKKPTIKKPRKKPAAKRTQSAATSLEDKLIESIPTAGISYQPSFSPLVQTPVFFWSDIPTVVTKKIEIVGEVVNVRLHPTFIWHYGDGVIYVTRKVGAAYPNGEIRHTYSKPGHYLIELITRWDGEFTIDGISAQIPGEITTVSVLPITVVAAPIRFMN